MGLDMPLGEVEDDTRRCVGAEKARGDWGCEKRQDSGLHVDGVWSRAPNLGSRKVPHCT